MFPSGTYVKTAESWSPDNLDSSCFLISASLLAFSSFSFRFFSSFLFRYSANDNFFVVFSAFAFGVPKNRRFLIGYPRASSHCSQWPTGRPPGSWIPDRKNGLKHHKSLFKPSLSLCKLGGGTCWDVGDVGNGCQICFSWLVDEVWDESKYTTVINADHLYFPDKIPVLTVRIIFLDRGYWRWVIYSWKIW